MGSRLQRGRRLALAAVVAILVCAVPAAAAPGWAITPSPNPTGAQKSYLDGVSCTGPTSIRCFAVGSYVTTQGMVRTLIERWDGTSWTVVASPNRTGALTNALVGVSCVSET